MQLQSGVRGHGLIWVLLFCFVCFLFFLFPFSSYLSRSPICMAKGATKYPTGKQEWRRFRVQGSGFGFGFKDYTYCFLDCFRRTAWDCPSVGDILCLMTYFMTRYIQCSVCILKCICKVIIIAFSLRWNPLQGNRDWNLSVGPFAIAEGYRCNPAGNIPQEIRRVLGPSFPFFKCASSFIAARHPWKNFTPQQKSTRRWHR